MRIERPCICCGTNERSNARDPTWAAWTGELNVAWLLDSSWRELPPEIDEEVEIQLRGPFSISGTFHARFTPWPGGFEGLSENPEAVHGVRLVALEPLKDLGDGPSMWGIPAARIRARVVEVRTIESLPHSNGPPDPPPWGYTSRWVTAQTTSWGAIVSFSMQGDVSGEWWLRRTPTGWRLFMEEDDAGLHYGWAYAGDRPLTDEETAWLLDLTRSH